MGTCTLTQLVSDSSVDRSELPAKVKSLLQFSTKGRGLLDIVLFLFKVDYYLSQFINTLYHSAVVHCIGLSLFPVSNPIVLKNVAAACLFVVSLLKAHYLC